MAWMKGITIVAASMVSGCLSYGPIDHPGIPSTNAYYGTSHFMAPTAAPAADKSKHLGVGLAVASYVTQRTGSSTQGCVAALATGVVKEVWDSMGNGTASIGDAVATGAGCGFSYSF